MSPPKLLRPPVPGMVVFGGASRASLAIYVLLVVFQASRYFSMQTLRHEVSERERGDPGVLLGVIQWLKQVLFRRIG